VKFPRPYSPKHDASRSGESDLQILSFESSIFRGEGLDFPRHCGSIPPMHVGPGESLPARSLVHRQDESTKLIPGMVGFPAEPVSVVSVWSSPLDLLLAGG